MFRFLASRPAMLCLAVALFSSIASAQLKVAVINVQKAISDTDELKKDQAAMTAKYQPRTDAMEKIQKDLESIDTKINDGKLNQQEVADLQTQGTREQRDLQRMQDDMQSDSEKDRQDVLAKLSEKMQTVIAKLAQDKGLDMIVEASQTLYFKPALDLTAEATAAYNTANPAK